MTNDFWDCKKCIEQYRSTIDYTRLCDIGERIHLLEKQAEIHEKEHLQNE
jgi:hypothetical protein